MPRKYIPKGVYAPRMKRWIESNTPLIGMFASHVGRMPDLSEMRQMRDLTEYGPERWSGIKASATTMSVVSTDLSRIAESIETIWALNRKMLCRSFCFMMALRGMCIGHEIEKHERKEL